MIRSSSSASDVAEFDFDAARQWARFDPQGTLARRSDSELPFVSPGHVAGQALLLDTCVYIDQMQDRSPEILDDLISHRQVNHSTVAIQELMHAVGVLDGRAALLSGMLYRLQGYRGDHRLRALQDCVLFLQAQKLGLVVFTANVSDYDVLLQLIPAGRVLFYRRK